MTVSGVIDFGFSLSAPLPVGTDILVATDGSHHAVVRSAGTTYVGGVESQTVHTTITQAQWRAHLAGLAMGTSGTYDKAFVAAAPGTNKFIIGGSQFGSSQNDNVYVVYEIAADASVSPVGGGFFKTGLAGVFGDLYYGGPVGQAVIDGVLYVVMELGTFFPALADFYLIKFPLSGTHVDTTPDSFNAQRTALMSFHGGPFPTGFFSTASSRQYYNRASLLPADDGQVRIIGFNGSGEAGGCIAYSCTVDSLAHTTGPLVDLSGEFGLPFADALKTYAGAASSNARDDYTAPSIVGDGTEVVWARTFSDNKQYIGYRRFTVASDGTVAAVDNARFQMTVAAISTEVEFAQAYRESGDLIWMIRDNKRLVFASSTLAAPSTPEGGGGPLEDVDDAKPPCDVDWPACDLTPQNIRVEVVSPTVSPGRSFTSREQIVQPDAGSWRIVYENIRVIDRTHALLWREIESKLNGRVGVVCVPVYEGRLSDVDVVATCSGGTSVGAVYVDIEQTAGVDIVAGQHFTAGDRLYRVKDVLRTFGGITTVKVWPPLREDISDTTALDFNTPSCRCRLATDQEMNIRLELLRFAAPSVTFLEDV